MLQDAKKDKGCWKIAAWSYDGKILVKTKSRRIKPVNNRAELEDICSDLHHPKPYSVSRTSQGSQQTEHETNRESLPVIDLVFQDEPMTKIMADGSVCFLSETSPLSNWYPAPIQVDNVTYGCNEQFFFASKAKTAGDDTSYDRIMATNDPGEQKKIGEKIKLNIEEWNEINIMKIAVDAKFDQHQNLRQYLLDTEERQLCEASRDKFWGIGVHISSRDLQKIGKWKNDKLGKNQLGKMLMDKRKELK